MRNVYKIDINIDFIDRYIDDGFNNDLDFIDENEGPSYSAKIYYNENCIMSYPEFGFYNTYEETLKMGITKALNFLKIRTKFENE